MDASERRDSEKVRAQFGGSDILFGRSNLPKLVELRVELIEPNPNQPRKTFDEDGLRELASSIESHGLIQPITVSRHPEGDGYLVVAGERRFRAFQLLGRETIPAIISTGNIDEIALIENLQREDLKPLEEAEALEALRQRHGYTQEELARIVSKAKSTISELLSLNELPEPIKAEVRTSELPVTKSVLIEISRLKREPEQLKLWDEVKAGRRTVRAARQQKEDAVRNAPTAVTRALSAGRTFVGRLKQLPADELTAESDQYRVLLELKGELDAIIAALERRG